MDQVTSVAALPSYGQDAVIVTVTSRKMAKDSEDRCSVISVLYIVTNLKESYEIPECQRMK